ncbi:MAG TPA: NAD(P)/FAD-dependent oxidoreductase [Thermoleophilaceae bacterium]|nr:NAD(P)/FAD-dependent oxidoreductase [Thermoleophilaceae bacterium]
MTSSPATACPRAGSTWSATARRASCWRSRASRRTGCRSRCSRTARCSSARPCSSWPSGSDLARRATDQARRLGAELLTVQDAVALRAEGSGRIVELSGGGELSANCVLVASGVSYRQLDAPGFPELTGAGVYYGAALAEARSCADQHVVIIGGANSAGQGAVHFSAFAGRVTMLVRGPALERSMSHYLIEQLAALPNVTVRTETVAIGAEGEDGRLRRLRVRGPAGEESAIEADACFVFIGASPRTDWLEGVVARDERGFILAGTDVQANGWPLKREPYLLETSVPGIFVAGDVRARSIKRVASAVGEGSMAVSLIHEYLANT